MTDDPIARDWLELVPPVEIDLPAFRIWLRAQGATVLPVSQPDELLRFKANGKTRVLHKDESGNVRNSKGVAWEVFQSWQANRDRHVAGGKVLSSRLRGRLLARDGHHCWYCGRPMPADDMTVEHLVSRHAGGPDHLDNLVLAHGACNRAAANLPLVRKIELRERMRDRERSKAA